MSRITFSWSPDYNSDKSENIDVSAMEASVEYTIDVPENAIIAIDDIYSHVDNWLRGCGYCINQD